MQLNALLYKAATVTRVYYEYYLHTVGEENYSKKLQTIYFSNSSDS